MRILFLLLALCCLAGCATTDYREAAVLRCNSLSAGTSPDVVIQSCTEAINYAGWLDGKNTALALTNRGGARQVKHEYALAIPDFSAALQIDPGIQQAYADRGASYAHLGNYDAALADLDRSLSMRPSDPIALNTRCWTRARANVALDAALIDCDSALALAQGRATVLDSRGLVEYRMGRLADAQADYDAALRVAPRFASSLYMRGLIKRQTGDTAGGQADIAAAEAIAPDIAATFAALGIPKAAQPVTTAPAKEAAALIPCPVKLPARHRLTHACRGRQAERQALHRARGEIGEGFGLDEVAAPAGVLGG